jgi:putative hydrolase of HD superfamily
MGMPQHGNHSIAIEKHQLLFIQQGVKMKPIADLLFEACFLKNLPRSGYQYLGAGSESVAEHVYGTTFIAFVMAQLEPNVDALRLISMCLVHDLPETRVGDLNYVQKHYLTKDESGALRDTLKDIPFADRIESLTAEFEAGETLESRLAHDADQLALLIDLKSLKDTGYQAPDNWLPHVRKRLKTELGKGLGEAVLQGEHDGWWRKLFC